MENVEKLEGRSNLGALREIEQNRGDNRDVCEEKEGRGMGEKKQDE